MDNLDKKSNGFINHVFSMNEDQKIDFFNLLQYGMLALIPVLLLNKLIQTFVPEATEEKGSLEILVEIVMQLSVLLVGIYYIHRVITYIPTYSGEDYGQVNLVNMVLAFLVIVMSLQTKLGEKGEILYRRLLDLWYGDDSSSSSSSSSSSQGRKSGGNSQDKKIRVSQPLSTNVTGGVMGGGMLPATAATQQQPMIQQQPIVYDPLNRNMVQPQGGMGGIPSYDAPQYGGGVMQPNFDQMYQEPIAANEAFGGMSAF
jgi:hypothetical protein